LANLSVPVSANLVDIGCSECRGIKFSTTGELLSRPFHKFFNWNEISGEFVEWHSIVTLFLETKSNIDLKSVKYILEKYDGYFTSIEIYI
jgi:hypothetical protein